LLSGVWLLLLLLVAQALGMVTRLSDPLRTYLPILCWGGHIVSPVITAWGNPAFRTVMRNDTTRFVVVPAIFLVVSVVLGVLGDMGWSSLAESVRQQINPRFAMFLVFMAWNVWHFSSQHFGVLSIYRHVANRSASRDRTLDRTFSVVLGCVLLPLAWYSQGAANRLGPLLDWLPPPARSHAFAGAIAILAGVLTVVYMARELFVDRRSIPRTLYIFSIGIQPICAVVAMPVYHFAVFTACHWMIALALSGRISSNLANGHPPGQRVFPDLKRLNACHAAHVGVLMLFSVPLYYLLFRPAAAFGAFDAGIHFAYRLGETSWLLGALSGGYFGITFVHFIYDRHVYSFRNPAVRGAIGAQLFRKPAGVLPR